MATNNTTSSNPRAEKMGDVLDVLSSGVAKTAAFEPKLEPKLPVPEVPAKPARQLLTEKMLADPLGVFSRTPSALAYRRRGAAVLEDRGEGLVPTQRH
jgi:hypothetical protein